MGEKTFSQSKTARSGHTALDRLDWGSPLEEGDSLRQKIALPEGVTSRELYADILGIAWPSLVELLLTQLTSMADLIMVGQLGPWAISSVGLTTQPKFLLSTMFTALNVGCMTMVARHKGAGRQDKAQLILRQSLMINLLLSVFFAVLGFVFAQPLVLFMGAQDSQTLLGGMQYLQIQMLGLPFLALTTTITNALRGAGDSKTALFYNTLANVVNLGLNYVFIYGRLGMPRLEVAGASLATSISQGVALLIALCAVLNRHQYVHLDFRAGFRPDREALTDIARIGLPSMIEQLCMRAGMIVYAKTVASLGTVMLACHQVCMNILSLTFMTGQAFSVSATSLVGQSLGKLRADMAVLYSRRTQILGAGVALVLMVVLFFFGEPIIRLYSDDLSIIVQGAFLLKMVAIIQPLQSSQFILTGALRGAGDTKYTAKVIFVTVMLVRPLIALFSVYVLHWGLTGAWIALVADQCLRTLLITLRHRSGKWKTVLKPDIPTVG
ncbi:MAG: MATE family efflux transporter [Candidatus Spyradocola sp.]|jgi:putative MATE family efflux protein